jgi:hypothetical protein
MRPAPSARRRTRLLAGRARAHVPQLAPALDALRLAHLLRLLLTRVTKKATRVRVAVLVFFFFLFWSSTPSFSVIQQEARVRRAGVEATQASPELASSQ